MNCTFSNASDIGPNYFEKTATSFAGPRIYVVGGKHCDAGAIKNLDTVECYDVEKADWIDGVKSLPLPLLGPSVTFTA